MKKKSNIYLNYLIVSAILLMLCLILGFLYLEIDLLLLWILSINVVTVLIFAFDKLSAVYKSGRVPNKILYSLVLIGGFVGGWIGMLVIRHKSRKLSYYFVVLLSTIIYVWLLQYFGYLDKMFNLY